MDPDSLPVFPDAPRVRFEEAIRNAAPQYHEDLMYAYRNFSHQFWKPESVFYPSCCLDVSPLKGFPDSKVVLLDMDAAAVEALAKHGIAALCMDVKDYKPAEKHDLVILLNSCFHAELATPHVADNGYVLANEWSQNVSQLLAMPEYEVCGFVSKAGGVTAARYGDWVLDHEFPVLFTIFKKIASPSPSSTAD